MPGVPAIPSADYDAVLFDLDGVLTDTASLHATAWKQMFDEFLRHYCGDRGMPFEPFEIATDYRTYVDGKPRYEGVSAFLESRRIVLPLGGVRDQPSDDTVHGLGNRKNERLQELLAAGVQAYPGSVDVVDRLLADGIRLSVVSSSRNARPVLEAAGLLDRFELVVDGIVADEEGIDGKPAPDTFLAAAGKMGVTAERSVVIEDAIAGVEAGRGGGFGLVIGVNREDGDEDSRTANAVALQAHGAQVVVDDLAELLD
ncbi:beta-phosphoglucomutase family hydrolase [soil metagenome]